MNFSKYISFFLLSLLLFACSGLKSSWTNFRAHYNTYYNAEKSFKAGIKKVNSQPVEFNPELPVRVHPQPPNVTEEDFDNAIDKGAQILRRFAASKWTDDALFLIGKSYYFKSDFYQAIEKFEELQDLSSNNRFLRLASIWKARSLLDLEQYGEGISFIANNLDMNFWSSSSKAEFKVLLAQHYAMQENWSQSAHYLGEALANLEENDLKARSFFLYGQVLERLGRYGEAFFAYDKVASLFPDYEYIFWSKLKKAEVARKEGNMDLALSIFTSMSKDDKNFSRLDRINYEMARTLEMQGNVQQAEQDYKQILHSEYSAASRNTRAKTYYRLGKIYGDNYNDFRTAAAYFDSSSSQVTDLKYLENNFEAERFASAFGSYARLRDKVNRLDSLLWLGSLEPAELDSVLDIVREQKRQSVSTRIKNRQDAGNKLANVTSPDRVQEANINSSVYGFLNYRNPRLKRESINEFNIVWGNRPLVDNWRRLEVVRAVGIAAGQGRDNPPGKATVPARNESDTQLRIDTSEIPTTEEKKNEYVSELVSAKYELGNLFFITLNNPDSAETYFNGIVRDHPNSSLVPQSMYSLFEIQSESGNTQRAEYWVKRIRREFTDSRYAQKVSARMNGTQETAGADTPEALLTQVQSIESFTDSASDVQAEQFRRLAIANRSADVAPFIHYRAIRTYVELAKDRTDHELYNRFLQAHLERDTTQQTDESQPADVEGYPFYGSYWDSVRTVIAEYDSLFVRKPHQKDLSFLREILDTSKAPQKPVAFTREASKGEEHLRSCEALNTAVVGGIANFLSTVDYPDELQKEELSGDITFEILITEEGRVGAYELIASNTSARVEQAFRKALENNLLLDPVTVNGKVREVSCKMTFPLKKPVKPTIPEPVKACKDLNTDLRIVGGEKNFLATVNYPEELGSENLTGEITFEILIDREGKVRSHTIASSQTYPAVEEAFGEAIERYLMFDPLLLNEETWLTRCSITFPIKN